MTTKKVIIISAATFFALNFLTWVLGWLIWPVVWVVSGYASIKVWEWTLNKMFPQLDNKLEKQEVVICLITGPTMGIVSFFCDGCGYVKWPKWLPKIRNPFVWKTHD